MPRPLLALASLVLLGSACAGPAPTATGAVFEIDDPPVWTVDGLRIATLNGEFLFDGIGDEGEATFPWKGRPEASREHRDEVAAVIRMLDADVVAIQETENLATLDMMIEESLADMGYQAVLVDGLDSFTGQDVGLLTRLPVTDSGRTNERVPVGISDQRYGVSKNLWVRLDLPDGTPLSLVGVHFLARPDDVERRDRREAQAEVIRRFVEAEVAEGREVVVLGDLNDFDGTVLDRRGSTPITDVLEIVKRAGPGDGDDLVNVLGDVPQADRFTSFFDRNRDGQFDDGEFSAIDHILLSPGLYRRVVDVRYVHAHDPREVSDHFPIVVTLAEE
ncbi:MAG: endonuclease/exonuclease/phosphatase family protein [Bacteroidota bacterium]